MFFKTKLHRAYQRLFKNSDGNTVIADLANYCAVNDTTYKGSTEHMLIMEGRRQVYLRIFGHTNLDAEEVFTLQRRLIHERDSQRDDER